MYHPHLGRLPSCTHSNHSSSQPPTKAPTCVLPPAAGTSAALTHLTQLPLSTSATLAAMPISGYTVCSSSGRAGGARLRPEWNQHQVDR